MTTNIDFIFCLVQLFLEREMFQRKVVEKTETHILYSITFFEKLTDYETTRKNIVQPVRSQTTIWLYELHAGYQTLKAHTHKM
jgi:hypothetical protein